MDNRITYIIAFVLGFTSCSSQKVLKSELTVRDSIVLREVEKEVLIQGFESKSNSINIDSLSKLLKSGVSRETIQKTLIREDPETKAKVGILIDELGNLTAVCEKQDEMIKILLQQKDTYRFEFQKIVTQERENIFKQIGKYIRNTLILIGLIIIGFIAFRLLK